MLLAQAPRDGLVVLTSRISIDMVQKTVALGIAGSGGSFSADRHAVQIAGRRRYHPDRTGAAGPVRAVHRAHRITPEDASHVA